MDTRFNSSEYIIGYHPVGSPELSSSSGVIVYEKSDAEKLSRSECARKMASRFLENTVSRIDDNVDVLL